MNPFGLIFAAVFLVVVAVVSSSASSAVNGELVLGVAAFCAGLSVLRVLPRVGRAKLARPAGLGLVASLTLGGIALIAGMGQRNSRLQEAAVAAAAAREAEKLESLAAEVPALAAGVENAFQSLDAGRLDEAQSTISALDHRFAPLQASALASRPAVHQGLEHLDDSRRALKGARETRAVEAASETTTARSAGIPAVVGLMKARAALRELHAPSPVAVQALGAVEQRLAEVSRRLPALNQPEMLLDAKLGHQLGALSPGGSRTLGGFSGAKAFSLSTGGTQTAFYLVAEPRDGALPGPTVSSFLEMALGTVAASTSLQAPGAKGSQATTVTVGTAPIHAGWADGRLVEVWVGDFHP